MERELPSLLPQLQVVRDGIPKRSVWNRRCYDHNCRDRDSVIEKINYCHNNPVKRGPVSEPGQWEWSSYRWYMGCRDVPLAIDDFEDSFPPWRVGRRSGAPLYYLRGMVDEF